MGNPLRALWCLLTRHRRADQSWFARQMTYRLDALDQLDASLMAQEENVARSRSRELRPVETAIFADEDDRRSGEDTR